MKLISWNVNGFRAVLNKGFEETFRKLDADVFCIQETKMQPGQAQFDAPGYEQYWYSAERRVTPARRCLQGAPRWPSATASVRKSTAMKAGPSRWNLKTLPGKRLHAQQSGRPAPHCIPHAVGRRAARIPAWAGCQKTRGVLRRFERGTPAHRFEKPGAEPGVGRFSDEERGKFTQLLAALPTSSARNIRTKRAHILGGAISAVRATPMPAGALTILSFPTGLCRSWRTP